MPVGDESNAPGQDRSWYTQQSPWTYVDQIRTPLLIEHLQDDQRTPIEQSEMLYFALKYLNQCPVATQWLDTGVHGITCIDWT